MTLDHLVRMANRFSQLKAGSPDTDRAIHDVLGREGPVLAYSHNEGALRLLRTPPVTAAYRRGAEPVF